MSPVRSVVPEMATLFADVSQNCASSVVSADAGIAQTSNAAATPADP